MSITFNVGKDYKGNNIQVAEKPLQTIDQIKLLSKIANSPIEACSRLKAPVAYLGTRHQLLEAVQRAHAWHYPLVLTPDAIWLTLTQGLANHINQNAEKLRKRFVSHEGKKDIIIRRDEFLMGSPENDWPGAFDEFSSEIKKHIGAENHAMIVADFSTTGPVERAASEVVLMDAMQSYFAYGMITCCGIPSITLEGTVEDWERMLDKVRKWASLEIDLWLGALGVVLGHFIEAAKGQPDRDFWNDIWNQSGGSGTPRVGGWLTWLFPYVGKKADTWNTEIGKISDGWKGGIADDKFPGSLSKVPFTWNYYGTDHAYEFVAGLTGVEQREDLALKPVAGWGVRKAAK